MGGSSKFGIQIAMRVEGDLRGLALPTAGRLAGAREISLPIRSSTLKMLVSLIIAANKFAFLCPVACLFCFCCVLVLLVG